MVDVGGETEDTVKGAEDVNVGGGAGEIVREVTGVVTRFVTGGLIVGTTFATIGSNGDGTVGLLGDDGTGDGGAGGGRVSGHAVGGLVCEAGTGGKVLEGTGCTTGAGGLNGGPGVIGRVELTLTGD
jgi:hypothetical protein